MSLWVFVYQGVVADEWLMEDSFRFLTEDGSSWVLEA
jgi:hypothetical protein